MTTEYIADDAALKAFCDVLRQHDTLYLDTEFIRESTYYPILCLIQIATAEQSVCIDPLTIKDLGPLMDVLYDPKITKVIHAGRQDMEILFQLNGALPSPLFDTQIAAAFLGYGEQIGYGELIKRELGVQLDKSHSRTDWKKRPLSPAQLEYALDDVRYLAKAYPKLIEKLQSLHRLQWVQEESAGLEQSDLYTNQPDKMWLKVKRASSLRGKALAVLQKLAAWRELTAVDRDSPRRRILTDDVLLTLARQQPSDMDSLTRIRGLHPSFMKHHANKILEIIEQAPEKPDTSDLKTKPSGSVDSALLDGASALLRLCADRAGISTGVLANRSDIEKLVRDTDAGIKLMQGWRYQIAGQELQHFLNGKGSLTVVNGKLTFNN